MAGFVLLLLRFRAVSRQVLSAESSLKACPNSIFKFVGFCASPSGAVLLMGCH